MDDTRSDEATACPRCGRPGVPIVYGMPGPELVDAFDRGEVALGGCTIEDDQPTHQCQAGHRWLDAGATRP